MRLLCLVLLVGCGEYELRDEMQYLKLSEIRPDFEGPLEGTGCYDLCRASMANHVGFVSCNEATVVAQPHLVCSLTNTAKRKDVLSVVLPLPTGLDPRTRGELDVKWCPRETCVAPVSESHNVDAATETISGCRVHVVDPAERFVACVVRLRYHRGAFGP